MTKLSEVREGDVLIADGGFTCVDAGAELIVKATKNGELYVDCRSDQHALTGQLGDDGETLVGLTKKETRPPHFIKPQRASRPNAQAFDEVRITTHPRYKESEISGDEWRISARIEYYLKGHLIGSRSWRNAENALRYGDYGTVDMFENGKGLEKVPDVSALCDQEGCTEVATTKMHLKKRYRNDGSSYDPLYPEYRCFCDWHKHRGDCGLDDADDNYHNHEPINPPA